MKNISTFFYQKVTLILALGLTVLTFGYLFLVMMDAATCFEVADSSVKSLGTSFGFTAEMVQDFFSIRSIEMIACYKTLNTVWDNIFALLYGFMYAGWLSLIFKPFAGKVKLLNLLPFSQVIFDWLENFQIVGFANSFLNEEPLSATAVKLGSFFTMAKWVCYSLVFVAILIGIGLRISALITKRKLKKNE